MQETDSHHRYGTFTIRNPTSGYLFHFNDSRSCLTHQIIYLLKQLGAYANLTEWNLFACGGSQTFPESPAIKRRLYPPQSQS